MDNPHPCSPAKNIYFHDGSADGFRLPAGLGNGVPVAVDADGAPGQQVGVGGPALVVGLEGGHLAGGHPFQVFGEGVGLVCPALADLRHRRQRVVAVPLLALGAQVVGQSQAPLRRAHLGLQLVHHRVEDAPFPVQQDGGRDGAHLAAGVPGLALAHDGQARLPALCACAAGRTRGPRCPAHRPGGGPRRAGHTGRPAAARQQQGRRGQGGQASDLFWMQYLHNFAPFAGPRGGFWGYSAPKGPFYARKTPPHPKR